MNLHSNARLTLKCRGALVEAVIQEGLTLKRAAARFRSASAPRPSGWAAFAGKVWLGYGIAPAGLIAIPRPPRGQRWPWSWPYARCVYLAFKIAKHRGLVGHGAYCTRHGLAKLSDLDPPPPAIRYQREHPGDLLHIDIKKLGRIVRPGHRVTGDKRDMSPAPAGSSSMWPSMMLRAWLTPKSCPMRKSKA